MINIKFKIFHNSDIGPNLRFTINGQCVCEKINILEDLAVELPLNNLQETNFLFVEHYDKNPNKLTNQPNNQPNNQPVSDVAAEILEIRFDNILLDREYMYSQFFFPNWQYGPSPAYMQMNCYLGFNGIWQLVFPKNYLDWILNMHKEKMFSSKTTQSKNTSFDLDDFKKDFF